MAGDDGSGQKTEKATAKKVRDARREGQVAKSRDLSQTATLLVWTGLLAGMSGYYADRLAYLTGLSWEYVDVHRVSELAGLGRAAVEVFLALTLFPMAIVGLIGSLAELMQVGPLFASKRIAPQPKRLNPTEGFKRMFSSQNLIEVTKAIAKTLVLTALTGVLLRMYLPDILILPVAQPEAGGALTLRIMLTLMGAIAVMFAFFSIVDWLVQKWQHAKSLRMSKSDVRREQKDDQGDPQIRSQRKRLHQQWANQNALDATRSATALLVNPTHIAIAIYYLPEETAAPIISAKAEGHLAGLMREAAREAGVPVVRNVALARALNFQGAEDEMIPEAFFDAVADIVLWAEQWRNAQSTQRARAGVTTLSSS